MRRQTAEQEVEHKRVPRAQSQAQGGVGVGGSTVGGMSNAGGAGDSASAGMSSGGTAGAEAPGGGAGGSGGDAPGGGKSGLPRLRAPGAPSLDAQRYGVHAQLLGDERIGLRELRRLGAFESARQRRRWRRGIALFHGRSANDAGHVSNRLGLGGQCRRHQARFGHRSYRFYLILSGRRVDGRQRLDAGRVRRWRNGH